MYKVNNFFEKNKVIFLVVVVIMLTIAIVSSFSGGLFTKINAGKDGEDGRDGANGKSAYELAVQKGYSGSLTEWLESLKGEAGIAGANGANGKDGQSAYQLAVSKGYSGTEEEWLESLKADPLNYDELTEEQIATLRAAIGTVDATLSQAGQAADAGVVGNIFQSFSDKLGIAVVDNSIIDCSNYVVDENWNYIESIRVTKDSVYLKALGSGAAYIWIPIENLVVGKKYNIYFEGELTVSANGNNYANVGVYKTNKTSVVLTNISVGNEVSFVAPETTLFLRVSVPKTLMANISAVYIIPYGMDRYVSSFDQQKYITCWGDSLTMLGGWTSKLEELSNMPVLNGGTGGENVKTIMARQGADAMVVNNIIIPANLEPVTIASRLVDGGISTVFENLVTPFLQPTDITEMHVNPCKIGNVEGMLDYNTETQEWTFTRLEVGESVVIDRPTVIRTNFDINANSPELMIIFMGQNGGYDSVKELIDMHRLMIQHSDCKNYLILGLSSGTAEECAEYEAAMKNEFGRYFISLREYLSTPIYDENEEIISCYGLADQNLEMSDCIYNNITYVTKDEIAEGKVPHQLLIDDVHFTDGTKNVVGELIYKKCVELGIFK